ncbi:MurR/RpiR family transcriptional regulator [Pelagibacterium lentulum]|uniref:RpiR family transcriptional regulator n=1 Tax=Pelagibacterium lentulum TaxID=2029865 RepID=A0A916RBP6_9HYPH|nr:MurR/RpiR family transcriptional regulator [Pelagibacterium lentulum]GGA49813.1 RpiR family transcriptional regulator [Pelagibacterium lentulum]
MSQPISTNARRPHLGDRGRAEVADVISALERRDGKLPAREQKVADYVKTHLGDVSTMTIAQLAGLAGVSTPTVVRFCRSLGCDGFREFKLRLAQNLAVSLQYLDANLSHHPTGTEAAIDNVLSGIYASANVMRKQLDHAQMEAAKTAILDCRQLVTAGLGGGSSMAAAEAANRLFRLGVIASCVNDSYIMQMRAATLGNADVLLLFSAVGETDSVISAAKIARSYGAATIAITHSGSRLAAAVDIPITIHLPEDPDIFKPTAIRYAFMIILDALALAVARDRPEHTSENLRRLRASLTAYHGRTGPQPLGD